jgi:hypothetical protein
MFKIGKRGEDGKTNWHDHLMNGPTMNSVTSCDLETQQFQTFWIPKNMEGEHTLWAYLAVNDKH